MSSKVRCSAVTKAGKPCKAWAIVGSSPPLCSAHSGRNVGAGAPPGNQNAKRHGFYSQRLTPEEIASLVTLAENQCLDDEIAVARIYLKRLLEYLEHADFQDAGFLAVVETGRFHYWGEDADEPLSDGWWFWQQCGHCIYEIKPGGTWERDLQWEVPASARVDTPAGPQPVHDDRLISAALVSVYDELVLEGVLRTGQGKAAVIKGRDPLEGMEF